jgi:hypothetical protein
MVENQVVLSAKSLKTYRFLRIPFKVAKKFNITQTSFWQKSQYEYQKTQKYADVDRCLKEQYE